MSSDRLPTLPVTADDCPGCTRRAAVQALGVTAAAALLGLGCRDDGGGDGTPDAGDPTGGITMCGANVCLDLNHPSNAALQAPGGSRVITVTAGKLIVFRHTATEVIALSAVCTHAGCTVRYDAAGDKLSCPCHGSQFAPTGAVSRGPAARALTKYDATLDGSGVVTIIV